MTARFANALAAAKANLARAREQEVALLRELYVEIATLHGAESRHSSSQGVYRFYIEFDPDPPDCGPYLDITIADGQHDEHRWIEEVSIEIGPHAEQPYQLAIRSHLGRSERQPPGQPRRGPATPRRLGRTPPGRVLTTPPR